MFVRSPQENQEKLLQIRWIYLSTGEAIKNKLYETLLQISKVEKNFSYLISSLSEVGKSITTSKKTENEGSKGLFESIQEKEKSSGSLTTNLSTSEEKFLNRKRVSKLCTMCPHINAKHYAKNMCSNCYHSKGRTSKPWNCPHKSSSHYALGLCQKCYRTKYKKQERKKKSVLS